jgi:serine/threonine protein kinase/formylglycine-generating enzyme required for sulfatase activity
MPHDIKTDASTCLTDESLAGLLDGTLASEELSRVHGHAAECAACRMLLATVVRGGPSQEDGSAPSLTGPESRAPLEAVSESPAARWTPPAEFDEFRLVRVLGRGAMGVVYLAEDRSLERQVAVKFIAAHQPDLKVRARFQMEARAIARLQHPNVVTVFRVGEVEGHPYLVSEYLEGQSLGELALPVPWRRALVLGLGLSRGLAAAHRQGVLHRDLKPSNVFLTAGGEVKLLDFGLAEFVEAGSAVRLRTIAGSPRYMAPELFRGASATPQSDLYALGLVLYELCTGALPPRRGDPPSPGHEPSAPGLAEPPGPGSLPPLTGRVPGIDPEFASLIERCLRVDPAERVASAEIIYAALERLARPSETDLPAVINPYRGLEPFEAEHRALFFGRDADIRAVLERLRRQSLVLVAGDSGVGKSSLCRAGILPRAVRGALDEYRDFSTLTLWPGRRPLAVLAAALAPLLGKTEAELGALLNDAPERLGPALRAAYQEGRGLLLFIDQLEELLTLSEPAQAARFASLLGELALPAPGVRVLLAVRGDFLTRLGALPGLGGEVERALYLLRPLTPEGVREAIVGPARSRGIVFESEALLRALVEAMSRGAGSLPLLQFALAELWERRDPAEGRITRAALEEMGGVAGALSRHADGVLARLGHAERQAASHMLVRLVTAEGTRSEQSEEELTAGSPEARTALRALVEGRLLHARSEGDRASYEIAHEALISSWGTLRGWLEENASQRVLRRRLEAAGGEWERMGRAADLLWRERQLDEARALQDSTLGPREQAFLQASRRAVRWRRLRRWAAVLVPVLVAGLVYGGLRLQAYFVAWRFVSARLEAAQEAFDMGRALGESASTRREKALVLFDGQVPEGIEPVPAPPERWPRAEQEWEQALGEFERAEAAYARAEQALDDALGRVHDSVDAQQLLIELTYERILLAERFHQEQERARLVQRFERLTIEDARWRGRLEAPAELELETEPPGARVRVLRYVEQDKALRREPVPDLAPLGATPVRRVLLPAGSYHLSLEREGHATVELPLVLERGAREHLRLPRPREASVPKGYVYIPPGCFLLGSDDPEEVRKFLHSAPLHRSCLREGYLIGKTEVTLGDWLAYLADTRGAAARRLLEQLKPGYGGALALRQLPDGGWSFSFQLASGRVLTVRAGESLRYPGRTRRSAVDWQRLPLAGVSEEDLAGYFAWLDNSGRLPGARLCSEHEWERAARGADNRMYPHGNRLLPEDANFDKTYDRNPEGYGPDEVGAHPTSASPFGLLDMAGNVFELTRPVTPDLGDIVLRGGGWYYEGVGTRVAFRTPGNPKHRDVTTGVRVCAPAPVR